MPQASLEELPATTGVLGFARNDSGKPLIEDHIEPQKSHKPMAFIEVAIRDARPIRDDLDLNKQGFVLLDHKTNILGLCEDEKEALCLQEMQEVVENLASDADLVIPCATFLQFRYSKNAPVNPQREETPRSMAPVFDAHVDFTVRSTPSVIAQVFKRCGIELNTYRRVVAYQLWRATSEPPHDFPLVVADRRSIPPGHYLDMMHRLHGDFATPGGHYWASLGLPGSHDWFYFSDLRQDELIVFIGWDSKPPYDAEPREFNVFHASFDYRRVCPKANPRASVEGRYFAFWK